MTTPDPFAALHAELAPQTPLRDAITAATRLPEPQAVQALLPLARLSGAQAQAAHQLAWRLADTLRHRKPLGGRAGIVQGLLQEFALSSQEGVALMCLAEALLRIPDAATRDALIRDKVARGQWQAHVGQSPSLFVNAAAWGLLLTGRLVATHSEATLGQSLTRIIGKSGEPLIRKGVDMAMRMMGEQFVTGETIEQALRRARDREAEGFRYSYDMLGEAALTADDAERYLQSYRHAIQAIGQAAQGRGIHDGPGISIKLSALHPRYGRAQRERVMAELYPRVFELVRLAQRQDIGLNIDAEEADRLELSLDLLDKLCHEPALAGWNGIGFVVQAYQKRCPFVIEWLVDLARRSGHRLMVRLVKGAYWDSEIKRAQLDGQADYAVFTRKAHTDLSYLACARKLLAAPDAVFPQFATHNAHSVAAIVQMAGPERWQPGQYEFQCLHGMGEPLYQQVVADLERPCRIYAPVGTHETLLAYLVRRLLENGANTSFVNRIADAELPIESLIEDPVAQVEREQPVGSPHPRIALPRELYGAVRANSAGMDLSDEFCLRLLSKSLLAAPDQQALSPCPASNPGAESAARSPAGVGKGEGATAIRNPADQRDIVGHVRQAGAADVEHALQVAATAAPAWAGTPAAERAAALQRAADAIEADMPRLMGLLVREAGKSWANAVAEVREALDFLRFYAAQVADQFDHATHVPLGPVACISPWNFPLAIFSGQVAAALAAGNVVLAKPAEQTPLIAREAVRHLHAAGVPRAALQLLPGDGATVGAALVRDARIRGVLFTGSTEVARAIQAVLAERLNPHGQPVPLIAETGGQNAMIVDSSALPEQVVQDVMQSAFDSAGQRCSALRVLCLQDEVADRVLVMLKGAMAQSALGNPVRLATDIGPVIDAEARAGIERHIDAMRAKGRAVHRAGRDLAEAQVHGSFVAPTLIEIERLDELEREVFGPVLHVLRYRRADLDALIARINASGYGLTGGVHTRIDETIARVAAQLDAGNLYVNRNMVGAVVGVQPFGGEGLSGTGPKAGGPLYLLRLLARQPADAARRAVLAFGAADGEAPIAADGGPLPAPLAALRDWARSEGDDRLAALCQHVAALSPAGFARVLTGPTGERNRYRVLPRQRVLCLADAAADRLTQLAAVLAVGADAVWPTAARNDWARLPVPVLAHVPIVADWRQPQADFDAVLLHGDAAAALEVGQALAARPGPIVGLTALAPGSTEIPLERLLTERAISINTAAAGGNASLMTME